MRQILTTAARWQCLLATGLVMAGLSGSSCEEALTLHVAPNGNDAWSGRLPEPNAAGTDGPLATVLHAQEALRAMPKDQPRTVLLRGGVYRLDGPLVLTPEDSGTADAPVIFATYPGEKPVLSGGRSITGFRQNGKLWETAIPEAKEGRGRFNQLFVNGQRRPRARTPNAGYFRMAGPAPPGRDAEGKEVSREKTSFTFRPGDMKEWDRLGDVVVVLLHSWESSIHPLKSVDVEANVVEFVAPLKEWWKIGYWEREGRYFVENALEFLDEPGEWYLNYETGVLSYYPLPDEKIGETDVIAPALTSLVEFRGEPEAGLPIQHVHLKGLTFHHSDWVAKPEGNSSTQAAVDVPAAIMADGAVNCSVEECELAHVGTYGLWFRRGCKDCRIVRNHVYDLGAGGIRVGDTVMATKDVDETSRTLVDNNYLHDGGKVFPAGVGIWVAQSSHNTISHNEVHSFNYSGVSLGWNWNEAPNRSHPNTVEHNHVHHVMGGMLSDGGCIYTLGTHTGTVIRNNLFHDVWPYMGNPAMAWGIYMDQGSNGLLVENNVVYNTLTGGIMNTGSNRNTIRNNIFAHSAWHAAWRWKRQDGEPSTFERNILYLTTGELFHGDGGRDDFDTKWDHNLYWRTDGKEMDFYDWTFDEWQAKGVDANSLIADPQFVDPDRYDFRLKPTSPAITRLGFQPIDVSQCGLYGDPEWVALPDEAEFPPTVLPPPLPPMPANPIDDGYETTAEGAFPLDAQVYGDDPEAGSSVRISSDQAHAGKHSLKLTDSPRLKDRWNPHVVYRPHFREGLARMTCALRLGPGASLAVEWRDSRQPFRVGPSLQIEADGRLVVSGKALTTVPREEWFEIEITCRLGEEADGKWELTVTTGEDDPQRFPDLDCGNNRFDALEWLGFVSQAVERTEAWMDGLSVDLVKQDER